MKRFETLPKDLRDPISALKLVSKRREEEWIERGQRMALGLFHEMADRVPAYQDFLQQHEVSPHQIKTINDLASVPVTDKDNYLRKYSLKDLSWDGAYPKGDWSIASTSGSTGVPFYFPRQREQDEQYALVAEMYLRSNFQIQHKKTLYIVAFPMGAWIGGVFTYEALRMVRERGGYDMSIITPGINKAETIQAFKRLAGEYDQVIIGSYAPFLKDILDDGIRQGIQWKEHNLGFVFSAEGFSETFRDYVIKKTGITDPYMATLNHYGTVDLGTMAHETPFTILARRLATRNEALYEELFGRPNHLPTFTQYIPELFFFEEGEETLLCSAYSGIPLVRYDLKDRGGILNKKDVKTTFDRFGIDIEDEARMAGIDATLWNLPFVHVYERSDFSVSFFAFQIYPETIRKALQNEELDDLVTGKFTMLVDYDSQGQQHFEVNVELKAKVRDSARLRNLVQKLVANTLLLENSEYRETYQMYGKAVLPDIVFWPYEHETYFKSGTKQKWVKK